MKIKMTALELILHLADGSTTANTLQHTSKIAKATLDEMREQRDRLHALNQELLEALKLCLPYARAAMETVGGMGEYNATYAADVALAKAA